MSLREIGRRLRRDHTSLSDELKRNAKYGAEYIPCRAQRLSDKRGRDQRHHAPLKNPLVFLYVREHLRMCWSPDEISGRIKLDHPGYSISYEAIYCYIYSKRMRRYKYWEYLTLGRNRRMKKLGRGVKHTASGKIPGSISIDLRPEVVSLRSRVGDWETDNIIGKSTDETALSVTVERVTKLTLITKLLDRLAVTKRDALVRRLGIFPKEILLTLTTDNGSENSCHIEIARALNLLMFFCHAYHSWEKGTVENTNGRIRRYIPKGVSMDSFSEEYIAEVERKLNSTPRKCLGYLTPYEKMDQVLSLL